MVESEYNYDLIVVGGGSGGISMARESAELDPTLKIALVDFVKPSPQGTSWSIGGTCVNAGCIPKKLIHFGGTLGELMQDQIESGWDLPEHPTHDWSKMMSNVHNHIHSLNWGYKVKLRSNDIEYLNAYAVFKDPHTLALTDIKGNQSEISGKYIVLAPGMRPSYGGVEGAIEHSISSDDLFWLQSSPGKTAVIGASYIALECAGFLKSIGYDVTIYVRSILLRGFDRDMAEKIGKSLEIMGIKFKHEYVPTKIDKSTNEGMKVLYYKPTKDLKNPDVAPESEEFQTILFAVGRESKMKEIFPEKAGIELHPSGKLSVNEYDQTNVPHIFALGDICFGRPELTPVAIHGGKLLAARLFKNSTRLMCYDNIPTTVFTPIEYGSVGLSEEKAIEKFGEENIEVYHTHFKPLEWNMFHGHGDDLCYVKLIVTGPQEKVVGFHILCPNAGEVTQGMAIAIKAGLTKSILDSTIGIHPTIAEEVVGLNKTKKTDPYPMKTAC